MQNYNNLANIGLGALQGQANAGQTYANNMGSLYQQRANLAAANANRPSGFQSALSGGLGGAEAGAAIGSAFGGPGIGTAIGAGIGVLGSLF
ncbi:Phage DNA transfer protein [Cronobacter malonaticus 681]|nr:Phage DNA transfer protein [Cronobacter malonaticus 681]